MYILHMSAVPLDVRSPRVGIQVVMSYYVWVLGTKLWSSQGAVQSPSAETYIQPQVFTNLLDMYQMLQSFQTRT